MKSGLVSTQTISSFFLKLMLLDSLFQDKVFGVPGDFVLGFNKLLEKHTNLIQWIGTCSELTAGKLLQIITFLKC
jgi:TPP-dependent 2-oxoacid decarboxylase